MFVGVVAPAVKLPQGFFAVVANEWADGEFGGKALGHLRQGIHGFGKMLEPAACDDLGERPHGKASQAVLTITRKCLHQDREKRWCAEWQCRFEMIGHRLHALFQLERSQFFLQLAREGFHVEARMHAMNFRRDLAGICVRKVFLEWLHHQSGFCWRTAS